MARHRIIGCMVAAVLTWPLAAGGRAESLIERGEDHDGHDHAPAAAEHDPHAGHSHRDPLHLAHPLVVESPLPENEARLQFSYMNLADGGGDEFTLTGTVEFAPVRWFSVEASAPLTHLDPDAGSTESRLGDVSVGLKFASFALQDHGVLLAAGLEVGLPTGNEERGIGNDHVVELEPWVGIGYKRDRFEWIGRVGVGLPVNQNGDKEADAELEWGTVFTYHAIPDRLSLLLEVDGQNIYGEEEDGYDAVSVTPGVRIFPFDNPDVSIGIGVRLPVTRDREQHVQTLFTVYFHF